jgi:serine protease inhibitor
VTTHLAFALALHRVAAPDPTANACWSPFSVASALGLAAQGARGMTRDELAVLLLGEKTGDLGGLGALLTQAARLGEVHPDDEAPVLAVSNTLWTDVSIEIREAFVEELARWSSGTVQQASFRRAPDEARRMINADVAVTTRSLIPELLPDGAIREDTRAALVNALYLKCAWINRFTEGATTQRPFHAPGGTVDVPTMELSESVGYAAVPGWQVVSLPAAGGVQAVVLLPDGDLASAEAELDVATLAGLLDAPQYRPVHLRLPKLEVSMNVELTPALSELGVHTMFSDDADFTGISPTGLAVQAVLHESVLKVDEQGLEGAAATAVMFRLTSIAMDEPLHVAVDRPFLLLIRHAATGVLYFVARVNEPVTPGS